MKVTALVLGLLLLNGCGAITWDSSKRFVNDTQLGATTFQAMSEAKWKQAQTDLSAPFCLNAAYMVLFNEPCDQRAPDPRAKDLNPDGLIVQSEPDAPDRPGTILCPVGHCDVLQDGPSSCPPPARRIWGLTKWKTSSWSGWATTCPSDDLDQVGLA